MAAAGPPGRRPVVMGASWMVVEAVGMSRDMRMFNKWSVHAPCMDHGRYKSPTTHVDLLGHPPPINKLFSKMFNNNECIRNKVLTYCLYKSHSPSPDWV